MSLRRVFSGRLKPLHFIVAAGVGVASGKYIFEQPLREHWEAQIAEGGELVQRMSPQERQRLQQQQHAQQRQQQQQQQQQRQQQQDPSLPTGSERQD